MNTASRPWGVIALTAFGLFFGLATSAPAQEVPRPRLPARAIRVPFTPQSNDYSCGAASMLSVLSYWEAFEGNEVDLYPILKTTEKDGTHPRDMTEGAKSLGLDAELKTGMTDQDLKDELTHGATVILDIQAWKSSLTQSWADDWEDGHYVVLIAMDASYAYFMDPSTKTGYGYIPLTELNDRWHDYEDRYGYREEYVHAGIVIRGTHHLRSYPRLSRIE